MFANYVNKMLGQQKYPEEEQEETLIVVWSGNHSCPWKDVWPTVVGKKLPIRIITKTSILLEFEPNEH